jgi:hypothetical protein
MAYAESRPIAGPRADPGLIIGAGAAVAAVALAALLAMGALQAVLIVGCVAVIGYAMVRPRAGVYITIFLTIAATSSTPGIEAGWVHESLAPYGINFTPVELVVGAACIGLFARLLVDTRLRWTPGALILPLSAFLLVIAASIAVGMSRGADSVIMRTETRPMLYLLALSLLSTHFLTTRRDLHTLMAVIVVAANIMAASSIYYYLHDVRPGLAQGPADLAFPHEDSLFCAAGIILVLARIAWSKNGLAELKLVPLIVLPTYALLVMRRRAGMVALDASLLLLCIVLVRDNFRMFLVFVPLAILGGGLLLAMTWNDPGGLGQPARSFRAITGSNDVSGRDQSSDLYRENEATNIYINIHSDPVRGVGFGQQYAFVVPLSDLSFWPLWRYVPHNSVMWVFMDAGILGFMTMMALFSAAIMRAMQVMSALRSDSMKPFAFSLAAMVLMVVMFSYVDLGLVTPRVMLFLGVVLGAIGTIGNVTKPGGQAA